MKNQIRLFAGIPVDSHIKELCAHQRVVNNTPMPIKWVPDENLHITACFFGEVPRDNLIPIIRTVRHIAKTTPPFLLRLQSFCTWQKHKSNMIWAQFQESSDLNNLHQRLQRSLLSEKSGDSIIPHITVARFKKFHGREMIRVENPSHTAELWVDRLILFESFLRSEGPIYRTVEEFPFNN